MASDPGELYSTRPALGHYAAVDNGVGLDHDRHFACSLALALSPHHVRRYSFTCWRFPRRQINGSRVTAQREFAPVHGSIRQGFVYERVPTSPQVIANNAEIDVIWDSGRLNWSAREKLNATLKQN